MKSTTKCKYMKENCIMCKLHPKKGNIYCHVHIKNNHVNSTVISNSDDIINKYNFDINKCFCCNDECNPHSQACGRCARILTMRGFCEHK
jgi:hypothetical protein